jgi:HK97 gp10 family phage protein
VAIRRSRTSGFNETKRVLADLPYAMERRVLQGAMRKKARVILDELKARAPESTEDERSAASKKYGHLVDNLAMRPMSRKALQHGQVGFVLTTRKAFWGFIQEFGSSRQGAKPWWRPAVHSADERATDAATAEIGEGLKREILRLTRKHGSLKGPKK